MGFSSKNTGVSCHALLQGIFQTKEWNLRLLHLLHWQAGSLSLAPSRKAYAMLLSLDCLIWAESGPLTPNSHAEVLIPTIKQYNCIWRQDLLKVIKLKRVLKDEP